MSEYRLIGYVQSGAAVGDGEEEAEPTLMYAGDSFTICYEIKLLDIDDFKKICFASFIAMYESTDGKSSVMIEHELLYDDYADKSDDGIRFLASVIESVMILQGSEYIGSRTLEDVVNELSLIDLEDYPEREEFKALIEKIIITPIQ